MEHNKEQVEKYSKSWNNLSNVLSVQSILWQYMLKVQLLSF